jgi:hypothetical protein
MPLTAAGLWWCCSRWWTANAVGSEGVAVQERARRRIHG